MGKTYGYARLHPICRGTENSMSDSQIVTLREMQVPERDIFMDRQEVAGGSYPEYQKMLKRLKAGDLLYIKSLDVLGTDYGEIGRQWRKLTKEKKTDVVVLDMPQLDTRRAKTQFGNLVADLVQCMLEYVPDTERLVRRKRQLDGIVKAKQRGVQFGRPEFPMPENFDQVYRMWRKKDVNGEKAARLCHMSKSLFYRKARQRKEMEMQGTH